MTMERIPVCLIVGFLGSGKTTLLRRIIRTYSRKRLAYIVNEFSSLDVDGAVIQREHDKVLCLAGGSLFCKCLAGQFIQTMKDLPAALHIPNCDGVVVEASGIADPCVAGRMLYESGLDSLYRLSNIIAVVDPGNIDQLLVKFPNTRSQLQAADTVIINKNDVYGEDVVAHAETAVRRVSDRASIVRASHCEVDVPLFQSRAPAAMTGAYAACADPNFFAIDIGNPGVVDVGRLLRALGSYPEVLYRAKGFLHGVGGPVYLDWTPSTATRFELPDYRGNFGFVLIGAGDKSASIRALASRLESGAFSGEPG